MRGADTFIGLTSTSYEDWYGIGLHAGKRWQNGIQAGIHVYHSDDFDGSETQTIGLGYAPLAQSVTQGMAAGLNMALPINSLPTLSSNGEENGKLMLNIDYNDVEPSFYNNEKREFIYSLGFEFNF